ncbi:MAG: hypothetical protein ACOYLH_07210 [Flavobacteriales bacterium]|jgi:hypothetical protein
MKNYFFILAILLVGFAGCLVEPDVNETCEPDPHDSIFVVQQGPFNFSIRLPKDLVIQHIPFFHYKENTGELIVIVGRSFEVVMTQEIRDLGQLKKKWESDAVLKTEIEEETANGIFMQQLLPDGAHQSYHYVAMVRNTQVPYYARTSKSGQFNRDEAILMRKAICSIQPLK